MVVLVMIGALSYFGVLNPRILIPSRCFTSPDLSCVDYQLAAPAGGTATVSVILGQGAGRTVYYDSVACEHRGQSFPGSATLRSSGQPLVQGGAWSPREQVIITCAVPTLEGTAGLKERVGVSVVYQRSVGGFIHEAIADVTGEVVG